MAFRIACLISPLLLLAALEGIIRLAGYGGYPPLLRSVQSSSEGTRFVTDNAATASYFFSNRGRPGTLSEETFLQPKPRGTVRILISGESAAKGFPQPDAFSAAAFLEVMLSDLWPDRTIEIINLGTTAVASYPMLDMLTQALACDPDLVIVYGGHNEFFGSYGVASLNRAGNSPRAIRFFRALRSLATVQFITDLTYRDAGQPDKTLMEIMVGQSNTPPDDPLRDAAAANLEAHFGNMIDRCHDRRVPVIVCTLPVNERDLAPLEIDDPSRLPSAERAALEELLKASSSDETASARLNDLSAAAVRHPTHALLHFRLGRALFNQKRYAEAAMAFQIAIDADAMPWRAPSRSIDAIRRAARTHNAILCDAQAAFRTASPGGCVGWELMDDHVHPSLEGQILLARTILRAMSALPPPLSVKPESIESLPDNETLAARLGVNIYDRYGVAHTVRVLCKIPFIEKSNPHAYDRFDRIARDLLASMPDAAKEEAHNWQRPESHRGYQRPVSGMAGAALIRIGQIAEAERLFTVARRCVPVLSESYVEYTYFLLACRERANKSLDAADRRMAAEAIAKGRLIREMGRDSTGQTPRYMGRIHHLCGEYAQAIPLLEEARTRLSGMDRVATDVSLIEALTRTGQSDKARRLARDGIQHAGKYASFYEQAERTLLREAPPP